jgi:hypothetical protein
MLLWKQGSQETSKTRESFASYDQFTEQEKKSQSSPLHSLTIALS